MGIYYVNAPCGAGKSYAACHDVKANLSAHNYLIAVNSYDHQLAWRDDLIKAGVADASIELVSCYEQDLVLPAIVKAIKDAPSHGRVVITTHKSFNDLPYLPRLPWKMIVDEVPEVQWFNELSASVTINSDTFRALVSKDAEWNPDLVALTKARGANFRRRLNGVMADKVGDGGWVRLFNDLQDPRRTVLVSAKQWEDTGADKTIGFLTVFNFGSITKNHHLTYLAANFENSFPHMIAKGQGVKLRRATFASQLRAPAQHRPLTIEYCMERLPSRRFLDFKGGKAKDVILDGVTKDWEGHDYLYVLNKDDPNLSGGDRLGYTEIRALNSKTDFDRIFVGGAWNLRPQHYNLLSLYGIDRNAANKAVALELAYQAVMRTSLRIPDSARPVVIRVVSKQQAEFLQATIGFGALRDLNPKTEEPLPRKRHETKINEALENLKDFPTGRRRRMRAIWSEMLRLARCGLPHVDIEQVCLNSVGNDREMRNHVVYEMDRLREFVRRDPTMPRADGLEPW